MKNQFKELKKELFFVGLLSIAAGFCMIVWPDTVSKVICYVVGGLLTVSGIFSLVMIFVRKEEKPFSFRLIPAAVSVVLGIFFLLSAAFVFEIMWVLFGALLIGNAYFKFEYGFDLKHEKFEKWWINLILATVSIIFGVILISKPTVISEHMILFTGIFVLVDGLCDLTATYLYASYVHSVNVKIRKEIKEQKAVEKAEQKAEKEKLKREKQEAKREAKQKAKGVIREVLIEENAKAPDITVETTEEMTEEAPEEPIGEAK